MEQAVEVAHQAPEGALAPPPEGLHGLQEAAAAAAAAGMPEDAHHAAQFHPAMHQGHLAPGQEHQLQAQGGHQDPQLQAEENLNELPEGADTKRCAACRIVKPVSEYYKDRTHSRGIKTRCKSCLRACKEAFKIQQRSKSAAEQVTVVSKKCSHCGQEKPAAEFSRSSYQRTGLRSWCKDCSSKSKKQAKAEGRWKSYDSKTKQPRKCRKCDELRQPDDFPIDPRNPTKRTRDCQYCLQQSVQGALPPGLAQSDAASMAAMGAWAPHLGEYWHMDPARAQQLQGIASAEAYQHPPASESLMRILRAAMTGAGDEQRRMTPEVLAQLGVYTDPNDPFSELPPDTQAAVIQQFVDQQQRQQHNALLHPGFGAEMLYQSQREAFAAHANQRPEAQLLQYAEQQQREAHEHEHEEAGQEDKEASPQAPAQVHHIGVGHFEQLRNQPYQTEGWQPPQHLQAHLQHQLVTGPADWPSAFAPTQRHAAVEASPKRQSPDHQE